MFSKQWALLLFLLQFTLQKWSEVKEIAMLPSWITLSDLFRDSSGNLHIVYKSSSNPRLLYLQTTATGEVLSRSALPLPNDVGSGSIQASFNKIRVVAAGNTHILLVESTDSGKTWSEPIKVSPTDSAHSRYAPRIVYVEESGRLFIFYGKYNIKDTQRTIIFVTRPAGSSIFSAEQEVWGETTFLFDVAYLFGSLHVFITGHDSNIFYTKSNNNGITWSSPTIISRGDASIYGRVGISSSDDPKGHILITFAGNMGASKDTMMKIMYSADQGNTWTLKLTDEETLNDYTITENQYQARMVKVNGDYKIMSFARLSPPKLNYGYWSFPSLTKQNYDHPFGETNGAQVLVNSEQHGNNVVTTFFVSTTSRDSKLGQIFVATDTQ